jgi:hypothetical protein
VRLIVVWSALKAGLLMRLEDQPIRFAFSRLNGTGWMTLLSRAGLNEQQRDVDRCIESMCQMLHQQDFNNEDHGNRAQRPSDICRDVLAADKKLRKARLEPDEFSGECAYELMEQIDLKLAAFGRELLNRHLIPYWTREKTGLVEREPAEDYAISAGNAGARSRQDQTLARLQVRSSSSDASLVEVAEEFMAIRYMSLTRAVLANMRYSMTFVSFNFVLTIVAWNSYPFQPRQLVDWIFTSFLVILGLGMVGVFAQMHRDPILSRITDTKPNELGWDFYLRILAYGAIPVVTWLTYQFPDIGNTLFKFVQPGTSAFK